MVDDGGTIPESNTNPGLLEIEVKLKVSSGQPIADLTGVADDGNPDRYYVIAAFDGDGLLFPRLIGGPMSQY